MADEDADKSQADDKAKSQVDEKTDDKTSEKSQAGGDKSQAGESISLEEAKKLRKEAQQLRRERDDAQKKLKEADDAKLSETERLQKQVKDLETEKTRWDTERRERDAREEVLSVLTDEKQDNKYRAKNARAVYKLIKDDIEFSDKGEIANLSDLLKKAKADYPELFGVKTASSVNGGDGSQGQPATTDMNTIIRQQAGRA